MPNTKEKKNCWKCVLDGMFHSPDDVLSDNVENLNNELVEKNKNTRRRDQEKRPMGDIQSSASHLNNVTSSSRWFISIKIITLWMESDHTVFIPIILIIYLQHVFPSQIDLSAQASLLYAISCLPRERRVTEHHAIWVAGCSDNMKSPLFPCNNMNIKQKNFNSELVGGKASPNRNKQAEDEASTKSTNWFDMT